MAPASLEVPVFNNCGVNPPYQHYGKQEYRRCRNNNDKFDKERKQEEDDDVDMMYEQYMASRRALSSQDVDMDAEMDLSDTEDEENRNTENMMVEEEKLEKNKNVSRGYSESELVDKIKELEQSHLESERDTCVFAGALEYLYKQLEVVRDDMTNYCPVCQRDYDCKVTESRKCVEQLEIKIADTKKARDNAKVLQTHEECVNSLVELKEALKIKNYACSNVTFKIGTDLSADSGCQSRMSFNMRMGSLTELRNQKVECLVAKQCFGCVRDFTPNESAEFLRKVDHTASQMQKELHIHLS